MQRSKVNLAFSGRSISDFGVLGGAETEEAPRTMD